MSSLALAGGFLKNKPNNMADKNIKDYLHLYLGCECETPIGIMELSSIDLHYQYPVWFRYKESNGEKITYYPKSNYEILSKNGLRGKAFHFSEIKPILRKLDSITDKEAWESWRFVTDPHYSHVTNPKHAIIHGGLGISTKEWANIIRYLLQQGFDIFGLIPSGLAIDKATLITYKQ